MERYEFERAMRSTLRFGDQSKLARRVGTNVTLFRRYTNPNDPVKSVVFRAAETLYEQMRLNETNGRKALNIFCNAVNRAAKGKKVNPREIRARAYVERTDFELAEAEGRSLDDRIKELEESIAADQALLEALYGERSAQAVVE